MSEPHPLDESARHVEAAAHHYLQTRQMHLACREHKTLHQPHAAHGPKLVSVRHHDHAALHSAGALAEHRSE